MVEIIYNEITIKCEIDELEKVCEIVSRFFALPFSQSSIEKKEKKQPLIKGIRPLVLEALSDIAMPLHTHEICDFIEEARKETAPKRSSIQTELAKMRIGIMALIGTLLATWLNAFRYDTTLSLIAILFAVALFAYAVWMGVWNSAINDLDKMRSEALAAKAYLESEKPKEPCEKCTQLKVVKTYNKELIKQQKAKANWLWTPGWGVSKRVLKMKKIIILPAMKKQMPCYQTPTIIKKKVMIEKETKAEATR
jgi:hypothetical protein